MNALNPQVKEILAKLPKFDFFKNFKNSQINTEANSIRQALAEMRTGQGNLSHETQDLLILPELGPFKYPDGGTYFGQFKEGKRHGFGEQIWADGSLYQGFFFDDMCNGLGRLIHVEGDAYQGDWVDDKAEGHGYYLHSDKTVYEGKFKYNFFSIEIFFNIFSIGFFDFFEFQIFMF